MTVSGRIREGVRTLDPGYFALVMATGIISIGMLAHGMTAVSVVLLWLAGIAHVVLTLATIARIIAFPTEFRADVADPRRGFAMFTFVAATDVVGVRLNDDGHTTAACVLLAIGVVAWLVLGYLVPGLVVAGRRYRSALRKVDGTWFVWAVASQSVAALAAVVAPELHTGGQEMALLAVFCWSVGIFQYLVTAILVAARMLIHPPGVNDLTPPYWIAMGATAITVLAGAHIARLPESPVTTVAGGLIAGASLAFWSFGTWLIPPLIAAGIWRHLVRRVPLTYTPALWSMVFPLGMYAAAGRELGEADGLSLITRIGDCGSWIALAVWTVTFAGMVVALTRALLELPAHPSRRP
ncbi:MAG: tellurite resistance/C4-dicarboxylate transporter family protein [Mycolicibacterium sp.]|nr:tellurite resistance/C4-dicarboxylate transporter family protein [Mycolicibacterium sp.]